jgi:hypothetical protein
MGNILNNLPYTKENPFVFEVSNASVLRLAFAALALIVFAAVLKKTFG